MKNKYIADSILGGITIDDELIYELQKTKEFTRLARVNHLGIVHYLYPMAKHYRLEHSLGVYELTRRLLKRLKPNVNETTYRAVLAAGLLHDLGHGPFSHLFELVSAYEHEQYSIDIINDPNSEVYKVFEKIEPNARKEVVQILQNKHPIQWCNQIISSEIDMDRLDYLLRDAQSTGAAYGQVDWRWLLKNARIVENQLVFKEKALSVIESMLLGRYHMNIAIYWNPKNVANQRLYSFWFNRMKYLYKNNLLSGKYRFLEAIFEDRKMTTDEFHIVDDSILISAVRYSTTESDEIIRKIADKFLRQETPSKVFGKDAIDKLVKENDHELEEQTWAVIDIATDFGSYQKNHSSPSLVLTNEGEVVKATDYSSVINPQKTSRVKQIGVKL